MRRTLIAAASVFLLSHPAPAEPLTLPAPGGPAPRSCVPPDRSPTEQITLLETFRDDFEAFDPYAGRWTPHFDHNGYRDWRSRTLVANGEVQLYVDPRYRGAAQGPLGLNPFHAADGTLTITARPTPEGHFEDLYGFPYVSGIITSRRSLLQRYGYFEIRARLPSAAGAWPAFWLLAPGTWPPEIDVLEARGSEPAVYAHLHWSDEGTHRSSGCRLPLADPSGFHTYGLLWRPDTLVYYMDRQPVAWIGSPPGLDRPMYLLANLAVGGTWAGSPDEAAFPAGFVIDWIAAYQIANDGIRS